jgi:transposase
MRFEIPEESLPEHHPARLLWRLVEKLDMSRFLAGARSVEGRQGRDLLSVKMMLTLWLYAVSEGIGSAREIERRQSTDAAFQWIVGDQRVGRTKLAEFRVAHRAALDEVLRDVLGVLMHRGLVSLDLVAQDGTRVRASASAPSFRRENSLKACREQARLHVQAVFAAADDPEVEARHQRAREAKAREAEKRIDDAIAAVQELCERGLGGEAPRASTTDPEARVMKMPDGGFRPAYNVQFATAGDAEGGARTIVGVRVTNVGSDFGSVEPMLDDIEQRTGELPKTLVADSGHAGVADIKNATERGVTPIIAVPERMETLGRRTLREPGVVAWRERMDTDEAKRTLRARASLCELTNAHAKQRFGLSSVLVRGLEKVTCVALLTALTANLLAHAGALLA